MLSIPSLPYQKTETVYDNEQTIDQSGIQFKTAIEIENQQNQAPEALKTALTIRSGDLGRAKAARIARTGSGAYRYVPAQVYCISHRYQPQSCSSRYMVTPGDD